MAPRQGDTDGPDWTPASAVRLTLGSVRLVICKTPRPQALEGTTLFMPQGIDRI